MYHHDDGSSERAVGVCWEYGYSAALQTGMKYACEFGYEYALQFDADGRHLPEYICSVASMKTGYGIVIGSR